MDKLIKISEAAKKYDTTTRTLRYYEEIGLLNATRDEATNYRYYDEFSLKRIEQILLLRSIDFSLDDISRIILSNNPNEISRILENKLNELSSQIKTLKHYERTVSSMIKISSELGAENIDLHHILKEQLYLNKNFERVIEMSEYIGDVLMIEFGIDVCGCCEHLIPAVKKMRIELEKEYSKEIPLVRIRDNQQLDSLDYRILIKDIIVYKGTLTCDDSITAHETILESFRTTVIDNLNSI